MYICVYLMTLFVGETIYYWNEMSKLEHMQKEAFLV
jgi:hypothetical protein